MNRVPEPHERLSQPLTRVRVLDQRDDRLNKRDAELDHPLSQLEKRDAELSKRDDQLDHRVS